MANVLSWLMVDDHTLCSTVTFDPYLAGVNSTPSKKPWLGIWNLWLCGWVRGVCSVGHLQNQGKGLVYFCDIAMFVGCWLLVF